MNLAGVPEIADGGYWYVVEAVFDPDKGGYTPGDIPGKGWCAWYSGTTVSIRTPEPVTNIKTLSQDASQLFGDAKPYGRVGGS